ncbi:MAG: DUF4114 domain-containing protein [Deltaproteobacteria bacterium]|nr:DUF4114 domain-containing protein [Deltaproteobacteria bacterium]
MRKLIVVLAASWPAAAVALDQPNGVTIPTPPGCDAGRPTGLAATFACACDQAGVCNIGEVCPTEDGPCDDGQNAVCETTMWHSFNDNTCIPSNVSGLDPVAEASVTPETFRPTCALTFTLLTRGTALFDDVFGWYNVTGSAPEPEDLHPMLDCDDAPGSSVVLDIANEPDYAGGDVGFFLFTPESHSAGGSCAGGNCCASIDRLAQGDGYVYYSERSFNPDQNGPDSYIHLLIYDSHVTERKFYFAWEDIYGGSNNDFTDLVTSVEGVECSGGGTSCDTGLTGTCAFGVTACEVGQVVCQELFSPEPEQCDGLDTDCDGELDDGATCPDQQICHDGRCVPDCVLVNEFDCTVETVCDSSSGLCVDPGCEGQSCPPDSVCRAGECVTPCEDVVCPWGRSCRLGACVDPCEGAECAQGEVCREGICFSGCGQCNGVVCEAGLDCDTATGECVDPSCPDGCEAGAHCEDGSCVDSCEGARCPDGQACSGGRCVGPGDPGADGGVGGEGDGGPGSAGEGDDTASCACRHAGMTSKQSTEAAIVLAAVLAFALRRRARGGGD